jgi:AcrR family transcriptional regulator
LAACLIGPPSGLRLTFGFAVTILLLEHVLERVLAMGGMDMQQTETIDHRPDRIRGLILATAKELFLEVGYEKTTIRKIVERSGVSSGSIYHWYKNKDEIFQALMNGLMKSAQRVIHKNLQQTSAVFQYVAFMSIELEAMEADLVLRGIYKAAYTSGAMFEPLVERHAQYTAQLFTGQFSYEACLARTILIRASMSGYILVYDFDSVLQREEMRRLLLISALHMYEVPQKTMVHVLEEIRQHKDLLVRCGRELLEDFDKSMR